MIKEAILKVVNGNDLNAKEAYGAMDEIMSGEASEVQMSAYLTALSMKGETIEEITASTKAMRAHCVKLLNDEEVLEIVGTGGDGSNTFNISTTSSIVISAAGVPVAKHGNRSASSKCGAADVLEALGVNIYIEPEKSLKILKEINLCFLFAQNYHLAMKFVAGVRKELSIRTIFNILGPLTNPAGATMQVLGVYDESLVKPLCEVLKNVGVKSALSVYGQDGLDEISVSDKTSVCELRDGRLKCYEIAPEDFGMERCSKDTLELPSKYAGDISENVENAILNALNIEIDDRTPDMERLEYELTTTDVVHKNRVTSKSRDLGRWPTWLKAVISASILAVLAVGTLLVTGVINWDSLIPSDDRSDARVPNVINLTVDDAEKILASENIDMKIVDKQESEDIPKDSVLSQNISGGSQVQNGMTVEIVVSSGKGQVYMPDFTGIGQAEAVEQVEKMGLHAKIETQESEIARDYICDQQYKEGEKVDKGSEILLKVSIGNSGYDESVETTIPDVVGETWENARKCAREKKIYIYKEETLNDSKVAQGNVIKQNHKSGEKEKQGFVLGVKVSLGVKMTHVPDVVYKSLEDARKLMDESNLQIEVEYEQSDKVEKDHVISQSIKPDTEVEEKTIIKLVVSKGNDFEDNSEATSDTEETTEITTEDTPTTAQETTTEEETTEEPEPDDEPTKAIVPDLSGCSEDSAISMLYDAGLSVGSIEYRSDPNSYDGAVLSQGVSAYSEVDYGTSVSLIICNNEKDESGNYICPEY